MCLKCEIFKIFIQGEFGIVYKARLGPRGTFSSQVAVKTLKGCFIEYNCRKYV